MTQTPQTVSFEPPVKKHLWPVAIGVFSILFALARLAAVCKVLSKHQVWTLARVWPELAALVLSVLLIVAGVQLARRIRTGAMLHLVWAAPSVIVSAIVLGMFLWHIDVFDDKPARVRLVVISVTLLVYGSTILYSLFLMVWFLRENVWEQLRKP